MKRPVATNVIQAKAGRRRRALDPAALAARLSLQPRRGVAAVRAWLRGGELGILGLAVLVGCASGLITAGMGAVTSWLHVALYGREALHGLSGLHSVNPLRLLLPASGGLVLVLLNVMLLQRWPRAPIDPIEANALHGGRMTIGDGILVGAQNIVSNGFGASVGLEAAYTQVGGGMASRLGQLFGLRRSDLRVLVGCGAAGAIAAAFSAPITGAFYAFELVIGTYAIASLAPVMASAVVGTLVANVVHGVTPMAGPSGIGELHGTDFAWTLLLGVLCGLTGIGLMRGMTLAEGCFRRVVTAAWLRPAIGGLIVGALALVTPGVLSAGHGALHFVLATETPARELAILLVLKAIASAVSIGSGFRGGLFFASLLLGALGGKLLAIVLAATVAPDIDPMLFAIAGTSAFGTAIIGAPLAMTFLALETTHDFAVAGAVLVAVIAASTVVRRLFGYSFATWRFHLRGEAIRSAHDIGWLRELTVGNMMRRDYRTASTDLSLSSFRRAFPLGSVSRVIVLNTDKSFAGLILVAEAHAADTDTLTLAALLRFGDTILIPSLNAKEAMGLYEQAEADALVVVDGSSTRRVIGLLTEAHVLRRYSEEVEKRRNEEGGLA